MPTTGRRPRGRRTGYNVNCRNRCRSRTLIERTDRYEVWMCTTCDDRRVKKIAQLSLFDVPHQPVREG